MAEPAQYIRFMASVTALSTERLLSLIDDAVHRGVETIHLLINSPGGNVLHGMALYNFLKGLATIRVHTYNFGTVDSIGVIVFCAGDKRLCVPHARFLLHPVAMNVHGNARLDEHALKERQQSLSIDQQNIAKVIATVVEKDPRDILEMIQQRTTFDPEQAKRFGLVTHIESVLIPAGTPYEVVRETEAFPPQHLPMQGAT